MFKKKVKKQQGVLQVDNEPQATVQNQTALQETALLQQQKLPNANLPIASNQDSLKFGNKHSKNTSLTTQNNLKAQMQTDFLKRARNQEILYTQDEKQQLNNEPKRLEKGNHLAFKHKGGIEINNFSKKEEIKRQVQEAFDERTYRAGHNLIKDMDLPEDQLEQEKAKRLFLQNIQKTKLAKQGKLNTKIYRGANAYANHKLTTNDIQNAQQAYKKKMGPSRVNSTIKNSCRFDYVLNLCKDWHDSGYCPFGNSCLYLHDRSNHKSGWELQKDFESQQRERWKRINNPDLAKKEDREKLIKTIQKYKPPQFCAQCNQNFKNPVQMECGHIFCSPCAIKMVKCKTCNKRLSGIMNNAAEKLAKLNKSYEQMVAKLQTEQQQNSRKKRKFQHVDGLDVFAD